MLKRRGLLLVLLLVLASQLSLTVHAANHFEPDYSSCEMCIAHQNADHALGSAVVEVEISSSDIRFIPASQVLALASQLLSNQPRAPPQSLLNH